MGNEGCRPAADFGFMTVDERDRLSSAGRRVLEEYLEGFVAKPNPQLGVVDEPNRAVCPFIPGALAGKTVYIVELPQSAKSDVAKITKELGSKFKQIEPCVGKSVAYKTLLLVFPKVALSEARVAIEEVQHELKPFFVQQGLMIGEFHPGIQRGGIHNPNFKPLQSPVPMLVIRELVIEDFRFLVTEDVPYSDEEKAVFVHSWLAAIANTDPDRYPRRFGEMIKGFQEVAKRLLAEIEGRQERG